MSRKIPCPTCGREFTARPEFAGKTGKCKGCGSLIKMPELQEFPDEPQNILNVSAVSQPNVNVAVNHGIIMDTGKSANALGVVGFGFGILALLVCWIPVINLAVIPLGAIGGFLAIIGLMVAVINKKSGTGWPVTGISLNVLAFLIMVSVNYALGLFFANTAKEAKARSDAFAAEQKKRVDVLEQEHEKSAPVVVVPPPVVPKPVASTPPPVELPKEDTPKEDDTEAKAKRAEDEAAKERLNAVEAKASSLLNQAKNHEKSNNTKAALINYRRIVADYGDTASAKEAQERIKVLTAK